MRTGQDDRISGTWDRMKGKTNQVVGDLTDDKSRSLKGHGQEARGGIKEAVGDIKDDFGVRRDRRV